MNNRPIATPTHWSRRPEPYSSWRSRVMHGYDKHADFLSLRPTDKENSVDAPAVEDEAVVAAPLPRPHPEPAMGD